jgi:hypothetical protein
MTRGQGGGPKTPEGKARSSRNALRHGLRSNQRFIIEDFESPEEWEEFRLGIIESWQPVGILETELAVNIAYGFWKLRRCRTAENARLSEQIDETEGDLQENDAWEDDLPDDAPRPPIDPERLVANQQLRVIPDRDAIDHLLRYEASVRKSLSQDMRDLEVQQARRQGERTPLHRLEVSSNSGPAFANPRRVTSADIPGLKIAQARIRMAEIGLAERKLAARKSADG